MTGQPSIVWWNNLNMNWKKRGHGLIKIIFRHFTGGTVENYQ